MSYEPFSGDPDLPRDIAEALHRAEASRMSSETKEMQRALSQAWEQIQERHDHTTSALVLREKGYEREFVLTTIEDLAAVAAVANEHLKVAARYAVQSLNIAGSTVAINAGVSQSTVSRWVKGED